MWSCMTVGRKPNICCCLLLKMHQSVSQQRPNIRLTLINQSAIYRIWYRHPITNFTDTHTHTYAQHVRCTHMLVAYSISASQPNYLGTFIRCLIYHLDNKIHWGLPIPLPDNVNNKWCFFLYPIINNVASLQEDKQSDSYRVIEINQKPY